MANHSVSEAFILWCPDLLDTNGQPFAFVYTDKTIAQNAKNALLNEEDYGSHSHCMGKTVGSNLSRIRGRANNIRLDCVPLLIGYSDSSDLRGLK